MPRYLILFFLALPAAAAPGSEAAHDMRCAALLSRVGDALERAGHRSTLPTVRAMQAGFLSLADSHDTVSEVGLMGELARTPPVALPASPAILAELEACAARLPR